LSDFGNEAGRLDAADVPNPAPVRILADPQAAQSAHPALVGVTAGSGQHPALGDKPMDVAMVADVDAIVAGLTPAQR
jgi:hypothetical protein